MFSNLQNLMSLFGNFGNTAQGNNNNNFDLFKSFGNNPLMSQLMPMFMNRQQPNNSNHQSQPQNNGVPENDRLSSEIYDTITDDTNQ